MKTALALLLTASALIASSAHASESLICQTSQNPMGSFTAVTIKAGGNVTVSGAASGGIAHFMASFGPFAATETADGDAVTYTFVDQFNQIGSVTLVTTVIGGKVIQTANSNYGLFSGTLNCRSNN